MYFDRTFIKMDNYNKSIKGDKKYRKNNQKKDTQETWKNKMRMNFRDWRVNCLS